MTKPAPPEGPGPLAAATPGGLPYPLSTDPLQQGANDVKALALAVEAKYSTKRVVYLPDTSYGANAQGVARLSVPGLTTVQGAVITSRSGQPVLIMVYAYPGGNLLDIICYVNNAIWASGFFCSIIAWGV